MKMHKWFEKKPKKEIPKGMGFMLDVNEREAIAIINSLSEQLLTGSPNSGRKEFFTEEGEYFSIGVHKETEKKKVEYNG